MSEAEAGAVAAVHIYAGGRVQGVGFRYFVLKEAAALDLSGTVRNTQDGRVEVWAEGPRSSLEALVQAVESGPSLASVKATEVRWGGATGRHVGFRVEA